MCFKLVGTELGTKETIKFGILHPPVRYLDEKFIGTHRKPVSGLRRQHWPTKSSTISVGKLWLISANLFTCRYTNFKTLPLWSTLVSAPLPPRCSSTPGIWIWTELAQSQHRRISRESGRQLRMAGGDSPMSTCVPYDVTEPDRIGEVLQHRSGMSASEPELEMRSMGLMMIIIRGLEALGDKCHCAEVWDQKGKLLTKGRLLANYNDKEGSKN